jgi:hypothetical protein
MSRALSLAGFQVTIIGRFWVTTEAVSHITGAEATGATKGTKQQAKKVPGERLKIRIRRNVAKTSHELDIIKELWMPQKGSCYHHSPRRGLEPLVESAGLGHFSGVRAH